MDNIQKEIEKLSHITKKLVKSLLVDFAVWAFISLLIAIPIFITGEIISVFIRSFDNASIISGYFVLALMVLLIILIYPLFSIIQDTLKICRLKKKKLLIDDNNGALNNSIAKYNDCKQQIEQIQKTIAQKSTELRNVDKQRSDIVGTLNRLESKNEIVQKFNSESLPITNMSIIYFIFCRN